MSAESVLVDASRIRDLPQSELPWVLRKLNERNAKKGPTRSCTPDEILATVEKRFGEPVQFGAEVHEALEVFCSSVRDDASLHFYGSTYARNLATISLETRARFERFFAANPAIDETELIPPVIICGLQRSGTTFLHRLLAEAGGTRSLLLWELLDPVPPIEGRDLRKAKMGATFHAFRFAAPSGLDSMHYMRPNLPDEDQFLLRLNLRSPVLFTALATFGYADFLFQTDMTESYQLYRRVLKMFQHFSPGKRLVLKNPGHALHFRELLQVMPDAHIVQTHRDPADTLPSQCRLAFTAQSAMTEGVDPARVVGATLRMQQLIAERSLEVRYAGLAEHVHDVDYRQLVADPVTTVRQIHERFDLGYTTTFANTLDTYRRNNRQHGRGSYSYTLDQFGLSAETVTDVFGNYRNRFLAD